MAATFGQFPANFRFSGALLLTTPCSSLVKPCASPVQEGQPWWWGHPELGTVPSSSASQKLILLVSSGGVSSCSPSPGRLAVASGL